MDDILDSLSKKRKDLERRLRGKRHKPDRTGANTAGENAGLSGSFLQPEPRVVAGGHDREGKRANIDVRQDRPRDRSPQPEPMLVDGSEDDRQRREADIDGKEASQRYSYLDPGAEVVVDSGHSQEAKRVYPSPSTEGPDST